MAEFKWEPAGRRKWACSAKCTGCGAACHRSADWLRHTISQDRNLGEVRETQGFCEAHSEAAGRRVREFPAVRDA